MSAGGGLERPRKLNLVRVVRAMVMSAGTPGGASQADGWRASREAEVPRVTRAACSRGCNAPRAQGLAALAARALAEARAPAVERPGPRRGVADGDIVDAPTVKGRDARCEACPGSGDAAARKGHPRRAGGGGAPGRDPVSPARDHDRPPRPRDASWRGDGRLADRAAARRARLRACATAAVRVVIRLPAHWPPTVDASARGPGTRACGPGTAREAHLPEDPLGLEGRAMDAAGRVGGGTSPRPLRRVGVPTPTGSGGCLTHGPPRSGPLPVAARDRGRWAVALRLPRDQSGPRRDQLDAARPCARTMRLQAARMASTVATVLAHPPHLPTRPPQARAPRTAAPRHPRLLALHMAVAGPCIAQLFARQGTAATRRGDTIAAWLTHAGTTPHWRRRPAVLEQ